MTHELKIKPEYFEAVRSGQKTFELRKNDRNYQVGDLLTLREWDGTQYTGRSVHRRIAYTLDPGVVMACEPGYLVLGLEAVDCEQEDADLIRALRQLRVETGSLACLGCGYEQQCSVHGCAILRAAGDRLTELSAAHLAKLKD